MLDRKIVFNASLPRSGSTLIQNILAQNPRFYCTPTSGVLDLMLASRRYYTELAEFKAQDPVLMQKGFINYCRYAINGFFEGITDKPVCVDKCRAWFHYHDWVKQFVPEPKYIVCVRDLRAILSSMEKLFRKNRDRLDADEATGSLNMITVNNRAAHWLNSPPVGIAVARLIEAVQTDLVSQLHIVRFEDLTAYPAEVMKKIYDYLEEPYFNHDFENVEQITHENDQYHTIYGDHLIRSKVKPVTSDFLEVLGKGVCDMVRNNYFLFYNTFYPNQL
jgi:sulfotransferase